MHSETVDWRAVAAVFFTFAILMLVGAAFPSGRYVLLVGWPGTTQPRMMEIAAAAGGSFVEGGGRSWLAVVHSEAPDFAARLMGEGAMIVLDHALVAGCREGELNERAR